ncbi:hypothetical protein [Burkholderia ubonensis]|uniref:hypothetical protein n=1 Tax=Burkholderia ubonensis TaxID=101571 RepID=UPI002ABDEF0A|nr:hypothetical protein [Burkholderia ubonensis]
MTVALMRVNIDVDGPLPRRMKGNAEFSGLMRMGFRIWSRFLVNMRRRGRVGDFDIRRGWENYNQINKINVDSYSLQN